MTHPKQESIEYILYLITRVIPFPENVDSRL